MGKKILLKNGFTLLELSFVIAIIGILMSIFLGVLPMLNEYYRTLETDKKLNEIKAAIIGFVASKGYLPNNNEFNTLLSNTKDGWNNNIIYSYSTRLINDDVCFRGSTEKTINGNTTSNDVAFVIQSKGQNTNSQIEINVDSLTIPETGVLIDNDNSDGIINKEYDDRLAWMTLSELRTLSGCETHPLRITTNELPYGYVGNLYSGKIFATDGIKYSDNTYTWCIVSDKLPNGLIISNSNVVSNYNNCNWTRGNHIVFGGTPTEYGSFNMQIFVRDNNDENGNNDNQAFKNLSLTINPPFQTSENNNSNTTGLSFSSNLSDLSNVQSKDGLITTDKNSNSLQMINSQYNGSSCSWFNTAIPFKNYTIRAYMNFQFNLIEPVNTQDYGYADGFTLSFINQTIGKSSCGNNGEYLGYGGLIGSSYASEVDVFRNANHNDPYGNHISFLKNGSVDHVNSTLSGNCTINSSQSGCKYWDNSSSTHFETGEIHQYRIEITNGYSSNSCNTIIENGDYTKIKVFLDKTDLKNDLSTDYSTNSPEIIYCDKTDSSLSNVYVGFTSASGSGTQQVTFKDFDLKYYPNTYSTVPVSAFTFTRTTQSQWNNGRCENVSVHSTSNSPIDWTISININNETLTDVWNAGYDKTTGNITFNNTGSWNKVSSNKDGEFGFCVSF